MPSRSSGCAWHWRLTRGSACGGAAARLGHHEHADPRMVEHVARVRGQRTDVDDEPDVGRQHERHHRHGRLTAV
jgi:hypothetical protein